MTSKTEEPIRDGQILTGPQFNEPMLVLKVNPARAGFWSVGLVGQRTRQFRQVTLTSDDIGQLTITDPTPSFDGDGHLLRLGLQAYALGIAHEFDPYFGLSISHVDPLPHQLEAVYEHLLKAPTVRFLLADDAGAGKTIMAGLLIRELKLRGLIERILVVCPANLSFQWQREMREKFDEKFLVFKGSDIRSLIEIIEIKGLARTGDGTVLLTPNERRVAQDRRDCYWLYVVTNCADEPELQTPIRDPARLPWQEVSKVQHYYMSVGALVGGGGS